MMPSKTGYEIRLKLLEMARDMLFEGWNSRINEIQSAPTKYQRVLTVADAESKADLMMQMGLAKADPDYTVITDYEVVAQEMAPVSEERVSPVPPTVQEIRALAEQLNEFVSSKTPEDKPQF